MVGQSERKHKAAQTTIPDAAIMRTIIATALAVVTATVLINSCKPATVTRATMVVSGVRGCCSAGC
jgi:phosphatidylserine/phosphatidylglycerophosphate/cardiolipin synthase-like enzyme